MQLVEVVEFRLHPETISHWAVVNGRFSDIVLTRKTTAVSLRHVCRISIPRLFWML